MEKEFEKEKVSKEVLVEWYKEKGMSLEDLERMEKKRKEDEKEEEIDFVPPEKPVEELKEKEEEKKLQVKAEVKKLLLMVEAEGLEKADKEAWKASPLVLDVFHDVLAKDRAYEKLIGK